MPTYAYLRGGPPCYLSIIDHRHAVLFRHKLMSFCRLLSGPASAIGPLYVCVFVFFSNKK